MDLASTFERSYWENGFFNVKVQFDSQVRNSNGPVTLILGDNGRRVPGRVNRDANNNGTARVYGNAPLRDWFQQFPKRSVVMVNFGSASEIRLYLPT